MKNTNIFKQLHVEQLTNKNQFVIHTPKLTAFQSYNSLIAIYDIENNTLVLGRDFDYSKTTLKHLKQFLIEYCFSIYEQLNIKSSFTKALKSAINHNIIDFDIDLV